MSVKRKAQIERQRIIARRPRHNYDRTDVLIARLTYGAMFVILFIVAVTGGGGF